MDIAAMSMMLSQAKVMQQANISVMRMAMDNGQQRVTDMLAMMGANTQIMEQSINPHIGGTIDVRV